MGSISDFNAYRRRRAEAARTPIAVSAFGVGVGECFLPWQAVARIDLHPAAQASDGEPCLHFSGGGVCLVVWPSQAGFDELERAMAGIFAGAAHWRARLHEAVDGCEPITLHPCA